MKYRNLARDPRVALSVCGAEDPYVRMLVRGRVVEFRQRDAVGHKEMLALRYLGASGYGTPSGKARVILVVVPDRVVYSDGRAAIRSAHVMRAKGDP